MMNIEPRPTVRINRYHAELRLILVALEFLQSTSYSLVRQKLSDLAQTHIADNVQEVTRERRTCNLGMIGCAIAGHTVSIHQLGHDGMSRTS